MIHTGLTSVTFRGLPPDEIIVLARQAGLEGIEWGGDIHVPHGDLARAREVYERTLDAGLRTTSYGSYYTVGCEAGAGGLSFERVLETALILHAPIIRVWARNQGSASASPDLWQAVVADARRIAPMAAEEDVAIAFEYHENTLADSSGSTVRLLAEAGCPNLKSYWQPLDDKTAEQHLLELKAVSPWLANLHVYHQQGEDRRPLAEGRAEWLAFLQFANSLPGDRDCLLEFVRDDSAEQFTKDAETLRRIFEKVPVL
jgi:sugar phosphate isomerase/epimerase